MAAAEETVADTVAVEWPFKLQPLKDEQADGINFETHVIVETVVSAEDSTPVKFTITRDAAKMSRLFGDLMEEQGDASSGQPTVIPVPCVTGVHPESLAYVLAYMEHHAKNPAKPIPKPLTDAKFSTLISEWDNDFIFKTDLVRGGDIKQHSLLLECMMAANFLCVNDLVLLCAATVGSFMRYKTPDQIRDIFQIENDLTPEQLENIKKRIVWVQE